MNKPGKNDAIEALRRQIDKIDDELLELLVRRVGIVEKVGDIKGAEKDGRQSIIRPGREAAMIRRMVKEGGGKIPPQVIAVLWRIIISSAIRVEENSHISTLSSYENNECYWMAREYFGSFTPITKRPTTMEVVKDVVEGLATVGVLPVWDEASPKPWWVRISESENAPMVFAKLPFVRLAPSKKAPVFSIGYVVPEETGDDHTLWVIEAEETISYDSIEPLLKESLGSPLKMVDHYRMLGNPTMRFYLVEVEGFHDAKHAGMEKFLRAVNKHHARSTEAQAHYLGSYATPIELEDSAQTQGSAEQKAV
jgi:chorismate mutase